MDGTIAALLDRAERIASMPARHAVPALVAGTALQVAVLGRAAPGAGPRDD